MVTAEGDIIDVSEDSYPDLFWGIRGAGSNFGIITSATYKLQPLTDDGDVFIAEFIVSAAESPLYFQTLEAMQPLPAELSSIMLINSNPETNQVCCCLLTILRSRLPILFCFSPYFFLFFSHRCPDPNPSPLGLQGQGG